MPGIRGPASACRHHTSPERERGTAPALSVLRRIRSVSHMATNPDYHLVDEPEDPIHEEVRLVMSDPDVRARVHEAAERNRRGEGRPWVSSNEVRRRFGLPPVPGQD